MSSPKKFRSSVKKDFINTIGQQQTRSIAAGHSENRGRLCVIPFTLRVIGNVLAISVQRSAMHGLPDREMVMRFATQPYGGDGLCRRM